MRICDCSSDVCSSDLELGDIGLYPGVDLQRHGLAAGILHQLRGLMHRCGLVADDELRALGGEAQRARAADAAARARDDRDLAVQCAHHAPPEIVAPPSHTMRSEEHTSELQSLMRISYAVFCLKKKTQKQ